MKSIISGVALAFALVATVSVSVQANSIHSSRSVALADSGKMSKMSHDKMKMSKMESNKISKMSHDKMETGKKKMAKQTSEKM